MDLLPAALPGTAQRILATTDLAAELVPRRVSRGVGGTCYGVVELLGRERERQATVWLDAGDLTVGPAAPLLGRRPWRDIGELPIDAAAAGNHEFDDGVPALLEAASGLGFPLLCANVDVGLPGAALVDTAAGALGVIGLTQGRARDRARPDVAVRRGGRPAGSGRAAAWGAHRRRGAPRRDRRPASAGRRPGVVELVTDAGRVQRRERRGGHGRGHALGGAPAGRAGRPRPGRRAVGRRGAGALLRLLG